MHFRKPSSRWALWVFAAALLLKSAMPWLANAAAESQGKSLVEVCTVYGIASAAPQNDASRQDPGGHSSHHEPCALAALSGVAAEAPSSCVWAPPALGVTEAPATCAGPRLPDACARWIARQKRGPPAVA